MTWVAVVKFWAYQLQLIVYTNLTLTLHGLELFSSANRQWIRLEVHQGNHYQSFPIAFKYGAFAILINTNDSDANNIYRISAGGATNSGFYYSFTFGDKKDCFAVCFGI